MKTTAAQSNILNALNNGGTIVRDAGRYTIRGFGFVHATTVKNMIRKGLIKLTETTIARRAAGDINTPLRYVAA